MNNAKQFLEDLQGLLIYLKHKNGTTPSLEQLLEKQIKEPEIFKTILADYSENHNNELKHFFEGRQKRIQDVIKSSLLDIYHQYETIDKNGTDEEFEEELKNTTKYYEDLVLKLPTKYQELASFSTTSHLLDEIIEAASITGYTVPVHPIIGTISNNSINAGAFTLENGEPIIIVDEDFLSFIHLFSKIFVQCLPMSNDKEIGTLITRKDEIIQTIKNNPEIINHFKDFIKASIEGSPRKAKQYLLPKDTKYIFCTYLMISAELFMIGHEVGHILKHHDNSKLKFWYFNKECVSSYDESRHEREFEADKIGVHLAMQAMAKNGFQADFCYIGIECFFIVNDIALKAKKLTEKGHEEIGSDFKTHPSNQLRREKIRAALREIISPEDFPNATYLPDIIDEIMGYLWESSKDVFTKTAK